MNMGLDMYLRSAKKTDKLTLEEIIKTEEDLWKEGKGDILEKYGDLINTITYDWTSSIDYSFYKEEAYWRKANAIHKWFVDNVQNGEDDCGYYEVKKEDIEKLYYVCLKVLNNSFLVDAKVPNGATYSNGEWKANYTDGQIIVNPEIANELLPTASGFFFGSTDYNNYYIDDVAKTCEICYKLMNEFDFDKKYLLYHSSW